MKQGDQIGQGVGYLDDGTMVVVERGRPHIGQEVGFRNECAADAGRADGVRPRRSVPQPQAGEKAEAGA